MIREYTKNLEYETNFKWIDIVSSTEGELEKVAIDYSLSKDLALKCLSPNHLPN